MSSDKDFAVILLNTKQYVVSKNSRFKVDSLADDAKVEVLLAEIDGNTLIGEPTVDTIGVKVEVTEDKKDKKISVRRFRNKSRYRRHKGHRQPISIIHIADFGSNVKNEVIRVATVSTPKTEEKKVEKVLSKSVKDLDLTDKMKESLIASGYKTADDVKKASKEDLLDIKGFGAKAVEKLLKNGT